MSRRRDLEGVGEAAFSIDRRQLITEWNTAAESAFGHASKDVIGRHCHEVLCGEDLHGNAFCRENCNIYRLVQRATPVRSFVVSVRCASGERKSVRMTILPLKSHGGTCRIVHFALDLHQSDPQGTSERSDTSGRCLVRSIPREEVLTRAEVKVLRQVAHGLTTTGIAEAMGISPATVRTHVRNLLRKLGAHTRAEAVHLALRQGLLR